MDKLPLRNRNFLFGALAVFSLSVIVRLWFWLYTHWAIEDALIIARMVRNLVSEGQFTYNLGTRVSSSTAPLFAIFSAGLTFCGLQPLDSARWIGLFASAFTVVGIYRVFCRFFSVSVAVGGSVMYMFLPPVVAYSVGGMETALYTLLCFLAIDFLVQRQMPGAIFLHHLQHRSGWMAFWFWCLHL